MLGIDVYFLNHFPPVSGRSSAYGDATAEGHPAGPGSVSSSTGAISTATGHQEGDGSEGEGEGEAEGDVHTSNRSGPACHYHLLDRVFGKWEMECCVLSVCSPVSGQTKAAHVSPGTTDIKVL